MKFITEDGASIEAAYFKASSKKAVIFAHGAIFDKESWCFLAEKFQDLNIASLSIEFRVYKQQLIAKQFSSPNPNLLQVKLLTLYGKFKENACIT